MGALAEWFADFVHVLFPRTCEICGRTLVRGEKLMCLDCRIGFPYTGFHSKRENPLTLRLVSRTAPIETAVAMFFYDKDSDYSKLIQRAKYNGRPEIDRQLASEYASQLLRDGFFDNIDLIVPVPMAHGKLMRRGYNQALEIADSLGKTSGIDVGEYLTAKPHSTQTRKHADERLRNVKEIYSAIPEAVELGGYHILVVDDVITTGATMLACCAALRKAAPTAKISILSIAATQK